MEFSPVEEEGVFALELTNEGSQQWHQVGTARQNSDGSWNITLFRVLALRRFKIGNPRSPFVRSAAA